MNSFLSVARLRKSFGDQQVLKEISLGVGEGEVLVLLGPSGSGKTTLLRLIAGFEDADGGSIRVDGEDLTSLSPSRRNFGMVFQHYALFPHLTVGENVAFGLEARGWKPQRRRARVEELLPLVGLEGLAERRIEEISGGQQQRVALARALAGKPRLLLLDEPLSNLDPELRERTRRQVREIVEEVGLTAVWVTHEQEEAFEVGDRIALLNAGRLEQIGPPESLYLEPETPFVARFVGRASSVSGTLIETGRMSVGGEGDAAVVWQGEAAADVKPGGFADLILRPEALSLVSSSPGEGLKGQVAARRYAGEVTFYEVELDRGGTLLVAGDVRQAVVGEKVTVIQSRSGPSGRIFPRPKDSA